MEGFICSANSSTGKTTLLQARGEYLGDSSLVRSWRATANGLEGVANRTSDVVLILDELGQLDIERCGNGAVNMLASGVGKIRMNRDATLQDIKTLARLHAVVRRNHRRKQTRSLNCAAQRPTPAQPRCRLLNVAAEQAAKIRRIR